MVNVFLVRLHFSFSFFRFISVLGGLETMMPLHSALASARLKSSIAVDSSCWSWLSQGKFSPLLGY